MGEAGGIMIPQDNETGSAAKPMNDPKEIEAFLSSIIFLHDYFYLDVVKKYTDKVKAQNGIYNDDGS